MKVSLICCMVLLLSLSCSKQTRTSDPQLTSTEMLKFLSDGQASAQNSPDANASPAFAQAMAMKDDVNTTIYFADAPGPMGRMASILAFDRMDFLGAGPNLYYGNIKQTRIFFLDNPFAAGGRQDVLLVGISTSASPDDFTYYGFTGSGALNAGQFAVTFNGGGGSFVVRTNDLSGKSLSANIQLRAYTTDSSGNEIYAGKFSNLAGFQ